ncbi:MAG: hypothetical protein ACR2M0_05090 [Chloroflexia bacterium]
MNVLAEDGSAWRAEFKSRARPFSVRWRRARLRARFLSSLWLPALALAALIALLRYTLVELPGDEAFLLLPMPIWLLVLWLSFLFDRPRMERLARAIDTHLSLDERLGTAVALSPPGEKGPSARLVRRLRLDALDILEQQGGEAARTFHPRAGLSRPPLILAGCLALGIGLMLLLPSATASARAERTALREVSAAQADRLSQIRRETVPRPELPPQARAALDVQLRAAVSALTQHPTDRAANVATLSQAEDNLRGLLPDNASQVSAARKAAARDVQAALSGLLDNPPDGADDFDKAAAASEAVIEQIAQLGAGGKTSQLGLATSLDRIARNLDTSDPQMAAMLRKAAADLRSVGPNGVGAPLRELAAGMRQKGSEQAGLDLLSNALSQVADSKQAVAEAGLPAQAAGGSNQADSRLGRLGPQGTGAQPGADQGASAAGGNGSNAGGTSAGGQGSGNGSSNAGNAGANNPPGNSQLNGNVQGGGGTLNGSSGGSGTGSGRVSGGSGNSGGRLVPNKPEDTSVYVPPAAVPTIQAGGRQDNVPGVVSPNGGSNGDTTQVSNGAGYNPGVKTPYTQVIGRYKDAAAQSLDHSYIPPDAKQYVRDYFNSLTDGK